MLAVPKPYTSLSSWPKIDFPQVEFGYLLQQTKTATPEIFAPDGNGFLNLMEGRWQEPGKPRQFISPIDGTQLGCLPMLDHATALRAVQAAKKEAADWARVDLDERKRRVQDCLDQLRPQVELVGKLLMWEIGKTYKLGFTDIDRAIDGVQWYVDNIESMLGLAQAAGSGQQHCLLELPHVGAAARGAGAGAVRQLRDCQNAHRRRLYLPEPDLRHCPPLRLARDAGQRLGRGAQRRAGKERRRGLPQLRGRALQRPQHRRRPELGTTSATCWKWKA